MRVHEETSGSRHTSMPAADPQAQGGQPLPHRELEVQRRYDGRLPGAQRRKSKIGHARTNKNNSCLQQYRFSAAPECGFRRRPRGKLRQVKGVQ
jgi:hypothetical protein